MIEENIEDDHALLLMTKMKTSMSTFYHHYFRHLGCSIKISSIVCMFTLSKFLGKKVPLLYPLRFVLQFTMRYMLESWV